jgi:predicted Rossmann-fold nucleotide-binding protein
LTGPCVTFLGGVQPNSPEEPELAEAVGRRFGELGYVLRHGGYNGLMERAAQYGSRTLLADQGDLGVPGESGALVEPA